MDPNYEVQPALLATLLAASITLDGRAVPVYAYPPANAQAPYVLVDQVSSAPIASSMACWTYECQYQFTILTTFPVQGTGDDVPSLLISNQVAEAIENVTLLLGGGYHARPIQLRQLRKLTRAVQNTLDVLRYISCSVIVTKDKTKK
jgi:hypothetical protein